MNHGIYDTARLLTQCAISLQRSPNVVAAMTVYQRRALASAVIKMQEILDHHDENIRLAREQLGRIRADPQTKEDRPPE